MPVTLAVPFRDHKQPPPLPLNHDAANSAAPPPLPSMRVPKGIIRHGDEEIDVHAAVLKARRATEELEWQAQVQRAKDALSQSEAEEWATLRARMATVPVEPPVRRTQPQKPALLLTRVPKALENRAANNVVVPKAASALRPDGVAAIERAAEEREWEELRARARLAEEREWEQLIARARASVPPAPFAATRGRRTRPVVVAWP